MFVWWRLWARPYGHMPGMGNDWANQAGEGKSGGACLRQTGELKRFVQTYFPLFPCRSVRLSICLPLNFPCFYFLPYSILPL